MNQTSRFPLKTSERLNELILTACRKLYCSETNNHNRQHSSCWIELHQCCGCKAVVSLQKIPSFAWPSEAGGCSRSSHVSPSLSARAAFRAIKNWSKSPAPLTKQSDKPLLKRNGGALCQPRTEESLKQIYGLDLTRQ